MPDNDSIAALVAIVESWQVRKTAGRAFTGSDLRSFVETQNYYGKRLITLTGMQDPALWESLAELATHCATQVTRGAKVFVDGKDIPTT